jgi:hypothetical protein
MIIVIYKLNVVNCVLQLLKIQSLRNYFYLNAVDEDIDIVKHEHHNNNHMVNRSMAKNNLFEIL